MFVLCTVLPYDCGRVRVRAVTVRLRPCAGRDCRTADGYGRAHISAYGRLRPKATAKNRPAAASGAVFISDVMHCHPLLYPFSLQKFSPPQAIFLKVALTVYYTLLLLTSYCILRVHWSIPIGRLGPPITHPRFASQVGTTHYPPTTGWACPYPPINHGYGWVVGG